MNNNTDICRLCMLNGGKSMEFIFCKTDTSSIADTIASVTHLRVFEGDGLPIVVCQKCLFQLETAEAFIRRCVSSDKFLRSLHLGGVEVYPVSDSLPVPSNTVNGLGKGGVEIHPISTVLGKKISIKEEPVDYVEYEEKESAHQGFVIGDDYEDDNITIKMEGLCNPIPSQPTKDEPESGSDSSTDPAEDDDDDEDYKPQPRYHRVKSHPTSSSYDITTRSIQLVAEKDDQTDYKCHLCPQKFDSKRDFKKHITHSKIHSSQCEPSDATNMNPKKTTDRLIPSQLKMFEWSDSKCEQKFRRKRALEQHKRRHTLDGKHKCERCGKTFHQRVLLRNHTLVHK